MSSKIEKMSLWNQLAWLSEANKSSFGELVCCPGCDDQVDYLHPVSVAVNRGGEITTVTSKGTHMSAGEPDGRGVTIVITFDCECGRRSEITFRFHKGQTHFVHKWIGPDCGTKDLPSVSTIWRD